MALTIDGSDPTGDLGDLLASKLDATELKVFQVVSAQTTTGVTVTSTSYTDTNLSATITPTSAANKILVLVSQTFRISRASNAGIGHMLQIVRGSTAIYTPDFGGGESGFLLAGVGGGSEVVLRGRVPLIYLDSPNTTSATTYKTQGKVDTTSNSGLVTYQESSSSSGILLVEVAP